MSATAFDVLRELPRPVQHGIGTALRLAQEGHRDPNAKPLRGFGGAGVLEVIEDFDGSTYRAVYTVKLRSGVYVLHGFQKEEQERDRNTKARYGPDKASTEPGDRARQGIATVKIKKANDNIFAELGFERPEEEAAKVDLAYEIFTILKARKLTQTKASVLLGISQADVSKLMNVRPHGFSLDRLIAILTRLARDVEIRVTKPAGSRRMGKVKTVLAA